MLRLYCDSSHRYLALGLYKDEKEIARFQEELNKSHSERFLPELTKLMKQINAKPADIGEIVVTDGPGSYTGMRVALTFVKTFSLIYPVKVYSMNTLLSLIGNHSGFSFIDARAKRVFGAYINEGDIFNEGVYSLTELESMDVELFGDLRLLSIKEQDVNIIRNMHEMFEYADFVENIDQLVPRYIK